MFPCLDDIVAGVPEYDGYLRLSQLEASTDRIAAAHPEIEVWSPGVSRAGHPIRCLEIPGGPSQALLVGLPHPEEPVGTLALEYLLPLLADGLAAELGFNFSIVKAGDPDATLINEPWFEEPYDLTGFLLRVYRPPLRDQFEWTFPVSYKRYAFTRPLPEAAAVMEVIGRRPLDFYMPLHNSNFSGAYFYLSAEDVELQRQLAAVMAAAGLPPHCGEPEVPYLRTLAPGMFRAFALADDYDFYEAYGADPTAVLTSGTSSDAYAEEVWDCFTLVAEVPYFTSPRIADSRPAGMTRREAKLRGLEVQQHLAAWLHERYGRADSHLTAETPWRLAVHAYLAEIDEDLRAERVQAETEPEFGEEATVAQLFDMVYLRELDMLERVGQFAAMLAAEARQDDVLRALHAEAVAEVRTRAERLASAGGIEAPPIRALVQCQVAALLCGLLAARDRYRPARPRPAGPRAQA
ncbi:MAG TPA: hypothetical protein VFH93_08510 [Thermoleophilia bacterium]|nr:hypothetical protein [Thermoleophilia bacterium]